MQASTSKMTLPALAPARPAPHPIMVSSVPPEPPAHSGNATASQGDDTNIIKPAHPPGAVVFPPHDPDSPVVWGRKPCPTDAENGTVLRAAFELGDHPVLLHNGWAYFVNREYNTRIEPGVFAGDSAGRAWAERLLAESFAGDVPAEDAKASEDTRASKKVAPSGPPESFAYFGLLPAEVRRRVAGLAMGAPGVFYYQLHPGHVEGISPRNRHPALRRPTCHSTWQTWGPNRAAAFRELAEMGDFEVVCLDRLGKYPLDPRHDLIVFSVAPGLNLTPITAGASPDGVYECYGKGLGRVALLYGTARYLCSGPHTEVGLREFARVTGNKWSMVAAEGMGRYCDGPCKAAVCRYVSFFRDADVIYFMVSIYEHDIHLFWKRAFKKKMHVLFVAKRFIDLQKAKNLDIFDDAKCTWVELEEAAAARLLRPSSMQPWVLTRYLAAFVQGLPAAARAEVNPRIKFKVLVTTRQLSHRMRARTGL